MHRCYRQFGKKPTSNRKTKSILLYEIAVHDKSIIKQFGKPHVFRET